MCLYFSNSFLVELPAVVNYYHEALHLGCAAVLEPPLGLYSLFAGPIFVIFVGAIIFGEVFFRVFTVSLFIIKLLYCHGLRKTLFSF